MSHDERGRSASSPARRMAMLWGVLLFACFPEDHEVRVSTVEHDPDVYVDVSQYGNAPHLIQDRHAGLVMAYVDSDPRLKTILVLAYSNDGGEVWTDERIDTGLHANRPALAYDAASDRLHMVHQLGGEEARSDLFYRRFALARDSESRIRGFVAEGSLRLAAASASRPTVVWTPRGGPAGTLISAWTTYDGRSVAEVRVSARRLAGDASDFDPTGWQAPDGSPETSAHLEEGGVAFDLLDVETHSAVRRPGLVCLVVREGSGPRSGSLYAIYSLNGANIDEWRVRVAEGDAGGGWIGGWSEPLTLVSGGFGHGRPEKQLTASCLYDDVDDSVWIAAAHYRHWLRPFLGADVVSLFRIDASGSLTRAGEVDRMVGGGSRHPMTAVAFDPHPVHGGIWVLWTTGNRWRADGKIRYRRFVTGEGFVASGDVSETTPNNYPNLLRRPRGDRLLAMFRTNTSPYTLRRAIILLPGNRE